MVVPITERDKLPLQTEPRPSLVSVKTSMTLEHQGGNKLECEFRKLVAKMPSEALAHFKTVDPNVWKVAKVGKMDNASLLNHGWSGPYCVTICGVKYEAFAKSEHLAASQVRFLHDWSGGVKRALKRQIARRELESGGVQAYSILRYVVYGVVLIGVVVAIYCLAFRWGGVWGI